MEYRWNLLLIVLLTVIIGLVGCFSPVPWQAMTETNIGPLDWRIYMSPGSNDIIRWHYTTST